MAFSAFQQFFSYRGSLRRHDLCICNLIVLLANQIPLQKFGSLIGTQLVVSNIRPFSRVHSPRARCEESVLSGLNLISHEQPLINHLISWLTHNEIELFFYWESMRYSHYAYSSACLMLLLEQWIVGRFSLMCRGWYIGYRPCLLNHLLSVTDYLWDRYWPAQKIWVNKKLFSFTFYIRMVNTSVCKWILLSTYHAMEDLCKVYWTFLSIAVESQKLRPPESSGPAKVVVSRKQRPWKVAGPRM